MCNRFYSSPRQTQSTRQHKRRPFLRPPKRRFGARVSVGHVAMVVSGLLATLLSYSVLRGGPGPVEVVVAAEEIKSGEQVTRESLHLARLTYLGREDVKRLGLLGRRDLRGIEGQTALRSIATGELVLRSVLQDPVEGPPFREMNISVEPGQALDLAPRDQIDVMAVGRDENLSYLVRGAQVVRTSSGESAAHVTILVPTAQAEAIATGTAVGATIRLARWNPQGDVADDLAGTGRDAP